MANTLLHHAVGGRSGFMVSMPSIKVSDMQKKGACRKCGVLLQKQILFCSMKISLILPWMLEGGIAGGAISGIPEQYGAINPKASWQGMCCCAGLVYMVCGAIMKKFVMPLFICAAVWYNTHISNLGGDSLSRESDWLCNLILLVGAVAAVCVGAVMAAGAVSNEGALFSVICCVLFWVLGSVILVCRPLFSSLSYTICASVLLYLSLCLRLVLFDHISPDYVSFLSEWSETMRGMSVREALVTPIGDYNMPYLYLLLLISRLPIYDLYGIKLASVLADVFVALAVGKLTALVTRHSAKRLLAFLAALLVPTAFLNSAYWGQCDSVYAAFGLWGLYFGLKRRPVLSLSMLALAFAFKLQAVFLLPIVVFLLVTGRVGIKHLPVFPGVFLGTMLPALLAGRGVADTFSIYLDQTGAYPYLSLNAPSLWVMIPNDYFGELDPAPVLFAGIVTLCLLFLFLRRYPAIKNGDLMALSLIFTLAIPWLLPKMHERYFYLAEMLSIVYAARYPRRLPVALVLLLADSSPIGTIFLVEIQL